MTKDGIEDFLKKVFPAFVLVCVAAFTTAKIVSWIPGWLSVIVIVALLFWSVSRLLKE